MAGDGRREVVKVVVTHSAPLSIMVHLQSALARVAAHQSERYRQQTGHLYTRLNAVKSQEIPHGSTGWIGLIDWI